METIHLDATEAIVGRLASFAAKQALLGKKVNIYNCEAAIISGRAEFTHAKYQRLANVLGKPVRGPFYTRLPDRFVRRLVRGMLPHHQSRGREAFKRIMCYIGVPSEFKKIKLQTCSVANSSDLGTMRRIVMKELVLRLGGKR